MTAFATTLTALLRPSATARATRQFALLALAGAALLGLSACPARPCNAASCGGCCSADGVCKTGDAASACGAAGQACSSCSTEQSCTNHVCVSANGGGSGGGGAAGGAGGGQAGGAGISCNPTNCADGCCEGNTCVRVANQRNQTCGKAGAVCSECVTGNTCTAGECVGPSTCAAGNCTQGCCSGNTCLSVARQGPGACGSNGAACMGCPSGETCVAGQCSAIAELGSSCTVDAQCKSLSADAVCKVTTSSGGASYPMGYCTVPCASAGQACANGAGTCIGGPTSSLPFYGESDRVCAVGCANSGTQSTCRAGYACYRSSSAQPGSPGYCFIDPLPPFDGGGSPDKLGEACAGPTDCQNPPDPMWGTCLSATLVDGGATGFTNGYCSADCTYDNTDEFCGKVGVCANFTSDPARPLFACLRTCPTPGEGRSDLRTDSSYVCRTTTAPDGGRIGYLWPACTNQGRRCPADFGCDVATGYCCDAGQCLD